MQEFWNSVTGPQATIIAAIITLIAAVLGVYIGTKFFTGRVKDLKGALDASDKMLKEHQEQVNAMLGQIAESLGQLRGDVIEISDAQNVAADAGATDNQLASREAMREDWNAIRDEIERIAADPSIDGRTRARYGRIDRRSYHELVNALSRDNLLGANAERFRNAIDLWMSFRNNRRQPATADANNLRNMRNILVPAPPAVP